MADSSLPEVRLRRHERSPGLHASTLLKELHPHPDPMPESQLRLYGLIGLAFEDRAEVALKTLSEEKDWPYDAFRPGEVDCNGVACSPDIILEPKRGFPGLTRRELSLKVTWKSCKGLPIKEAGEDEFGPKWAYYISQCQTYARPLETTGSVLLVYFVCGTWRPPLPQVHGWELDFHPQEIGETWDALETVRGELGEKVATPKAKKVVSPMEARRKR
jgi:hypothetical protein